MSASNCLQFFKEAFHHNTFLIELFFSYNYIYWISGLNFTWPSRESVFKGSSAILSLSDWVLCNTSLQWDLIDVQGKAFLIK